MPKVLVVENSPTQALRLKLVLKRKGWAVTVVQSGQEGIANAIRHPPEAIVLDASLPDIDSFLVCQTLKRHPVTAEIPVVMLTIRDRAGDTLAGLKAGADAYIPKDDLTEVNLLQTLRDLGILKRAADKSR